jgi:hypothetical protein
MKTSWDVHEGMVEALLRSMPPRTGVRVYHYSNGLRRWLKWPTLYEGPGYESALRGAKREARKNLKTLRESVGFDPGPIAYEVVKHADG